MNFLKRLFGFLAGNASAPAQVQPAAQPVAAPAAPAAPTTPPAPRIFLGWNEMIDADTRIAGYRLRPQALEADQAIDGSSLCDALVRENAQRFATQRLLIVPITYPQWQSADFRPIIAPHTYILLSDLATLPGDTQLQVATDIREKGARLAVDRTILDKMPEAPLGDLVLFDFHAEPLSTLEQTVRQLRQQHPGMRLAVDDIHSWAEHRLCLTLGIHFSLGSFASSRDEAAQPGQINESRLVVMDMLNQLRGQADLADLAHTATRDPAVVVKLLDMANSPLYGLPRKVANLEEAIMLLGRDALYRWLSLALFNLGNSSGHDRTLLVLALCRASLLESLVCERDRRMADELFLVGLLSVIDSLLGQPMAAILERIRLPDDVGAALLNHTGPYARYLQLALALERCQLDRAVMLAANLQIDPPALLDAYREALGWASAELLDH